MALITPPPTSTASTIRSFVVIVAIGTRHCTAGGGHPARVATRRPARIHGRMLSCSAWSSRVRPACASRSNLADPSAVPYFMWDEPVTVTEVRRRLASADRPERTRLLAKILREARDPDVWRFTSPVEVEAAWPALAPHLGRRRSFWQFVLTRWKELGLLDQG